MKKSYIFLIIILLSPSFILAQRVLKTTPSGINLVNGQSPPKPFMTSKISLPIVWTIDPTNVAFTTADGGGIVADDGQDPVGVTERGVCWNSTGMPTISDTRSSDGTGTGLYPSLITGLDFVASPMWFVRAYATNSAGTAYGNEVGFATIPNCGPVTDADGNNYTTVVINGKCYLRENLAVTQYNDLTAITNVSDQTAWSLLSTGAYCWLDNDIGYKNPYGALYNWYAVDFASNGGKNICPLGWHVPSQTEWQSLFDFVGGSGIAGDLLKEAGTAHWQTGNNSTNISGFTALPVGNRYNDGSFATNINQEGDYWTSTSGGANNARAAIFIYNLGGVSFGNPPNKYGNPVRCVQD